MIQKNMRVTVEREKKLDGIRHSIQEQKRNSLVTQCLLCFIGNRVFILKMLYMKRLNKHLYSRHDNVWC